jgi:hypothetical protein
MDKFISKAIRILVIMALVILVVSLATSYIGEHWHK